MSSLTELARGGRYRRALALDFDGTIAMEGRIRPWAEELLEGAVPEDTLRLIVTGRSFMSLAAAWTRPWPIDLLIYSSGAGIYSCADKEILYQRNLSGDDTREAVRLLLKRKVDFMIHDPIPDNHRFRYHHEKGHPDFLKRIRHYLPFARPFDPGDESPDASCQLLAVGDRDDLYPGLYQELRNAGFGVIHTTSPLDGESIWMEIFPKDVSKGQTLALLCDQLKIPDSRVFALGNDYNDYSMLRWAGNAFLVKEAPEELKREFPVAGSMADEGVPKRLKEWLG